MTVKELKKIPEGEKKSFQATLVVKNISLKAARNGADFLMIELGDKSGSFSLTCFSETREFEYFKQAKEGSIISVDGLSDHYRGRFSPKIKKIEEITAGEASQGGTIDDLVEISLEEPARLWLELDGYINKIKLPELHLTVKTALEEIREDFINRPAAISMHHAYRHGLLEHTVHVTRAAVVLLPIYIEVNPDLAIAGAILHDIGKAIEYEGHFSTKKSKSGILHGHVVLGYRMIRKAGMQCKLNPEILERLEHIILSHQGELEWGAATMAATPEAVFISMVDNLDAKMGMIQRSLRFKNEMDNFSEYIPGLKTSVLLEEI